MLKKSGGSLDGQRHGVAAAQAQRGDAAMHVAALHFVQQRRQNARARCADRVSDAPPPRRSRSLSRDRGAIAALRRSRPLRTLHSVRTRSTSRSRSQPVFSQHFFHGVDWRHHDPFGIDAAHGLRDDARHRSFAQPRGVALARDHQRRGAVIRAWSVARRHRAVLLECGTQFCQALRVKHLRAATRHI